MLNPPQTLEEARVYKYGQGVFDPAENRYKKDRCAYEVDSFYSFHQCYRDCGKGPAGLYCWQHAKMAES